MPAAEPAYVRRIEPRAQGWRTAAWHTGSFDTGRRRPTELVEGTIRLPEHLVLVTVSGGARRLEVAADCGHRYEGPDRAGAVSFVPSHCERRLRLVEVEAEWASIAISPALVDEVAGGDGAPRRIELATFTNVGDPFLARVVTALGQLFGADGSLDPLHGESATLALAHYLARRYGAPMRAAMKLSPWQLRKVAEQVDAQLGDEIRIADLAAVAGLSVGYFHRAFRMTTGKTPLAFIQEARIRRAVAILAAEPTSVGSLALRVGFTSPSHFSRIFRRVTGRSPAALRLPRR
jgi:AraC family transcriptional regulator